MTAEFYSILEKDVTVIYSNTTKTLIAGIIA